MCNCHSVLECCVMFSGAKLSMRSFNLFHETLNGTSAGGYFQNYARDFLYLLSK